MGVQEALCAISRNLQLSQRAERFHQQELTLLAQRADWEALRASNERRVRFAGATSVEQVLCRREF